MNEFPDPSYQPSADVLRRLRSSDTPLIAGRLVLAWPAEQPEPLTSPVQVRVIWNDWPGEIGGAGVRNANTQSYDSVWRTRTPPTPEDLAAPGTVQDRLAGDVRQAFADFLAEDIRAAVCPAPRPWGMRPPGSSAELFTVVKDLLDPRLLAAALVQATVQVAAVHAGIPLPVARVMGQAAKVLFLSLSEPDPNASKVQAVQAVDLALSTEEVSVIDSLPVGEIAVDEAADIVNRLLGPDAPPPGQLENFSPTSMSPASPFYAPLKPASPSPVGRLGPSRVLPTHAGPSPRPPTPRGPSPRPPTPGGPSLTSELPDPPSRHQPGPATSSDPVPNPCLRPGPGLGV